MEDPFARAALGPSLPGLRRPEARLRALLAGAAAGRREGSSTGARDGGTAPRSSPRPADDRPRARAALGIGNDSGTRRRPARSRFAGRAHARLSSGRSPLPTIDPVDARRELARRYLHVFGPASANRFARWAGISRRSAAGTFASLEGSLLPVRSPLGDEWLLAEDEPAFRAAESVRRASAPAAERRCLLPAPREPSARCLFRARISGSVCGRPACGLARCWSTARSAEPGGGRSTSSASMRGRAFRVRRATRSRPRPAPCRFPGLDRPIEVVWEASA